MATQTPADPGITAQCDILKRWPWITLRGILTVALGVVAILYPANALVAFALVFAAFSFADGIVSVITGLRSGARHDSSWWAMILRGILGIAIGTVFLIWPTLTTVGYAIALVWLFAIWATFAGVLEISAAIRLRNAIEGEWLLALVGIISLIAGLGIVVMLFTYPAQTMLTLVWVIGAYAIVAGVVLLAQSLRLRGHYERICKA